MGRDYEPMEIVFNDVVDRSLRDFAK
jgi:hypothetical protein